MSFELIAYDKLKLSVKESIKSLIEHHFPDRKGTIDINKLGESVKLLSTNPEGRGIQTEFLLQVIELTDHIAEESAKTLILNAAVYHIHRQIADTYRSESASDASTFNFSLKTSLGLNTAEEKRKPNDDDKHLLCSALVKFLEAHVYRVEHHHLVCVDKHPFSAIKGYNARKDIKELTDKVRDLAQKRFDTAEIEHAAAMRPASGTGLLSWIGLGGKKPVEEVTPASTHTP
jgi:hypothetical protein